MPIRNQLWEQSAALLAVGVLLGGCAVILAPFAPALLWAAIVSSTSWGIYRRLTLRLGNRGTLAASLLVAGMLIVIVLPLIYALVAFGAELSSLYELLQRQLDDGLPALPDWIVELPGVGVPLQTWWGGLAAGDPIVEGQVRGGLVWLSGILLQIGRFAGEGLGVLLLSCILVLFFYIGGERGRFWLEASLQRVAGPRGTELLQIATRTIKSVVFGILGTALAQGALAALGFYIAGVPMAIALGLGTALLSIVPFGTALLWAPAAAWLYHGGHLGWAIFIVFWGLFVVGMTDNVLKPLLIGHGADLPFLLIMLGVLGGAMSFGLLGVFLGPTFIAVGFALLQDWVQPGRVARIPRP
jgi:predicted PurR-regulated permease PerM